MEREKRRENKEKLRAENEKRGRERSSAKESLRDKKENEERHPSHEVSEKEC